MELFIAISLSIVLLFGLTLIFMLGGIPRWVKQLYRNSSTVWNFGIFAMGKMIVIIYLFNK
tara:strand:- start:390 stop:572 length:183 start_codon:yes stop_codon:yes gene_type:complete